MSTFAWGPPRSAKPAPPVRTVIQRAPARVAPPVAARPSSTSYYNPSRIIDRSRLKIVDSIAAERQREFAEERGDTVAPIDGGGISVPRNLVDTGAKEVPDTNIAKFIIPAIAAYFLFGA